MRFKCDGIKIRNNTVDARVIKLRIEIRDFHIFWILSLKDKKFGEAFGADRQNALF